MPRLPTLQDLGPRPEPTPSRGVVGYQATTGAETAQGQAQIEAGQTMAQFGKELSHWAAVEQEKADTTRVEDAWNQYKNAALQNTLGDNGVLRKQGGDAVNGNLLQTVEGQMQTARKQIAEKLSPEQLRRFDERANATDYQVKHQTIEHLVQQGKVYADTVQSGSIATAATQIGAQPADDRVYRDALAQIEGKSAAYLNSKGITDPGARDAYMNEVKDALLIKRIDTLLYNMPELAEAKFRGLADEITNPELRLQYQARTREISLGVVSTKDADKIIADVRTENPIPAFKTVVELGTRDAELKKINLARQNADPKDKDRLQELQMVKTSLEGGDKSTDQRGNEVYQPSTSGLPNSRDVAAQLPLALMKIEKMADERYGTDKGNPDRAAYIAKTTQTVKARISDEVQQLNAIQRAAQGALIDAITGIGSAPPAAGGTIPTGGNKVGAGGMLITSFSQIQQRPELLAAWQKLDPQAKLGLERLMEHNLKANATDHGDVRVYREAFNRIHLPEGHPDKIDFYQQIVDPRIANQLSIAQINSLRQEIDRNETPGGRSLNQMRKAADANVATYFKTNILFTAQPERALAATMRWNEDVGKKIDEYVKAGQPDKVRAMFQLDSPESVISQKYLQSYVNTTPANGLAEQAAKAKAGESSAATPMPQPATINTREALDAWFKTLPPDVTTFTGSDGKVRRVPPRAPTDNAAPAKSSAAAPEPNSTVKSGPITTSDVVMNDTGKIVTPTAAPAADVGIPTLDETPIKPKGARTDEQKVAATSRMRDFVTSILDTAKTSATALFTPAKLVERQAGEFIQQVKKLAPSEEERAITGFRNILKQGTFRANQDTVVTLNNFLASKQGTPAENAKAQKMLQVIAAKLGTDDGQ